MEDDVVEYLLLGPLEVRADGEPLRIRGPKQRALLALFVLNANRVVPRERLIDELWGESPPGTAVKALQVGVSQLRKVLPEGHLVTRSRGYSLEVEPEAVDLLRFERLVAAAREARPERAAALLRESLALWRGPALAELAGWPFARVEAGRLEGLRLAALEERLEAALALGAHAESIGELEALVAEHPHRERLRGQLMLALYRSGRQAEALEAYRGARAALDELGLAPGAMLKQLERRILAQDAALELPPERVVPERTPLPGPLVPTSPFPFIGRAAELEALRLLLERAEGGEGGVVLLAGEAGAGKTRLVRELAQEATDRGALVLYGASDAAVSVPYEPLRDWLEFLLRVADPERLRAIAGAGAAPLAYLLPELAGVTGEPAPSADAESDRDLLQRGAVELLRRVAAGQPLVLVADDVHWADAETLQLLRRLARTAPEARMLVIATHRDEGGEALSQTLAELARLDGITRLSLGRLEEDEVAAFVEASTGSAAPGELASALAELTGGTPLLLCELWRDLRESGAVEVSEDGVRLSRPLAELRGPERLGDVVRQRLSRLAPESAAVVELAAVAGPRFELRLLSRAAELDQPALALAIAEAIRHGLVEGLPDPAPAWRFTHELVRRSVYDAITGIRRAELHLSVGEALEAVHTVDPARVLPDLAHHFTLAAPVAGTARAIEYNLRAADQATGAAALGEAAARLRSALALGIDDPRERARVQVELAFLLNETGELLESDAILAESLRTASGLEERGLAAQALSERAGQRLVADPEFEPEQALALTARAIETLRQLGDERGLALAERRVALALRHQGRVAEGSAALERALVHAEACGDEWTRRRIVTSLAGSLCVGPTPAADALRRCEALLRPNRPDRVLEASVDRLRSLLLAMTGRFDEAQALVRRSSLVLDELGQSTFSTYRTYAAQARELTGDRAGAEHELQAQWREFSGTRQGTPDARAMQAAYQLAHLYCDDDRWDEAANCLSYGEEVAGSIRVVRVEVFRVAGEARIAAHRGQVKEAVSLARRAVELAERGDMLDLGSRAWLALAEAERARGATAHADAAVAAALELYERKGNVAAAGRLR